MTRNLLDKRMKLLISELAEMGSLVEKQIYNSIEAFRNKDMELATQVMNNDDKVDELNRKIEEQCLKLMAMESPVATDLRKIFTTSKIVTDLERMADYAVDICKIVKRVEGDIEDVNTVPCVDVFSNTIIGDLIFCTVCLLTPSKTTVPPIYTFLPSKFPDTYSFESFDIFHVTKDVSDCQFFVLIIPLLLIVFPRCSFEYWLPINNISLFVKVQFLYVVTFPFTAKFPLLIKLAYSSRYMSPFTVKLVLSGIVNVVLFATVIFAFTESNSVNPIAVIVP